MRDREPRTRSNRAGAYPRMAAKNPETWELRLYVAGQTPKAVTAFANLKRLCEEHLQGRYKIEVIDLSQNPQLAKGDQIFALPALVRKLPAPVRKIIGDLSNTERVLVGLDIRPRAVASGGKGRARKRRTRAALSNALCSRTRTASTCCGSTSAVILPDRQG